MLCLIMAVCVSACKKEDNKKEDNNNVTSSEKKEFKSLVKSGAVAKNIKISFIDDDNNLWLDENHFEKVNLKITEDDVYYLEIVTTKDGRDALENTTKQNIGKTLSLVVDDTLLLSATVYETIDSGSFIYQGKQLDPIYAFNLLTGAPNKTEGLVPPKHLISENEAKKVVFEKAVVSEKKVKNLEINLEFDENWRGWEYQITFDDGITTYECEVNATLGNIIKFNSTGM